MRPALFILNAFSAVNNKILTKLLKKKKTPLNSLGHVCHVGNICVKSTGIYFINPEAGSNISQNLKAQNVATIYIP